MAPLEHVHSRHMHTHTHTYTRAHTHTHTHTHTRTRTLAPAPALPLPPQAEDELAAAKASVTQALQMIPDYCHVGLITYGTHVHVHELGFAECSKCFVFRGSKEYTPQQVRGAGGGGRLQGM